MHLQTYNIIIRPPVHYYIIVSYLVISYKYIYHTECTGVYWGGRELYIHLGILTLHNYVYIINDNDDKWYILLYDNIISNDIRSVEATISLLQRRNYRRNAAISEQLFFFTIEIPILLLLLENISLVL